jgi:radical SAM superfamily enzyme YgiQ (UPF0313 family)
MNILYILPYDTTYRYKAAFVPSLSYQPLTLSTLAALTPCEYQGNITLVDEGVMLLDVTKNHYDIVGISICTSSATRGYELANFFKAQGSYILLGGHHATLLPEEAALHADSVFIGPAEQTLPSFFEDFQKGTPKPFYTARAVHAEKVPIPRRDLMPHKGYLKQPTIIADFGCGNACKYCVIHSFWGNRAQRPVDLVVKEIQGLGAKEVLFLDPSPVSNKSYAKELFQALIPLKIHWVGLATLDIAKDNELLSLMKASGCVGTLLGFETFNSETLLSMNKTKNKIEEYRAIVETLHEYGVAVLGTFMLGFDNDTVESIRETPRLIAQAKIDVPRYAIVTPYPNTELFTQLQGENRILHQNWSRYDSIHCVFQPKNMTPETLELEHLKVWKETFAWKSITKRLQYTPQRKGTALVTNIGFAIYTRRLKRFI